MTSQLMALIVVLPLVVFYAWMFLDLSRNRTLPPDVRTTWALAFLLFNVFAAAAYYRTEYRRRW